MIGDFPVVHAVTDTGTVERKEFLIRAFAVMQALGERGALHLRSSRLSGRRFHELASALAELQQTTGCWLIVNDRIDIARAVGARGIQLASHSLTVGEALLVAAGTPIGVSIHSVEEAKGAESAGASWCVAGAVFETPSHQGRPPARIEFIEQVSAAISIPVIAIGGVMPEDIPGLRKAGAYGVATIRGAGWGSQYETREMSDSLMKTRLPTSPKTEFVEPVVRYISYYDSDSGSGLDDHADGERSAPRTGPE